MNYPSFSILLNLENILFFQILRVPSNASHSLYLSNASDFSKTVNCVSLKFEVGFLWLIKRARRNRMASESQILHLYQHVCFNILFGVFGLFYLEIPNEKSFGQEI